MNFFIQPLFSIAGVGYAFENSDGMGKFIVVLLFFSSMGAWFIMIEKGLSLYRAQKLSQRLLALFETRRDMYSLLRESASNPSPVARVYLSGMEQVLEFYGKSIDEAIAMAHNVRNANMGTLSSAQIDAVQASLEREVASQIIVIEGRIGALGTAISLSPFLGLFGTVWGVMIAFCGVASAGSANIQALAPGVAGALLTTVAGLIVAIPSLIGYNVLTLNVRKITVLMDNFSEAFMARLKVEQLTRRDAIGAVSGVMPPANPVPTQAPIAPGNAMPRPAATIPANRPIVQPGASALDNGEQTIGDALRAMRQTQQVTGTPSGASAFAGHDETPGDGVR